MNACSVFSCNVSVSMRIVLFWVRTQQEVVILYHYLLRHNPEERNSQLLCDRSLQSHIVHLSVNMCPQNLPFLFQLHAVGLQLFAESEDVL